MITQLDNNLNPVYIRKLWDEAEAKTTPMSRFNAISRIVDEVEPYQQDESANDIRIDHE